MNSEFADLTPQEINALLGKVDELVERRISEAHLMNRLEQVKAGRVRPRMPWSVIGHQLRQLSASALLRMDQAVAAVLKPRKDRGTAALGAVTTSDASPAIELIAADLRRLDRHRHGIAKQSPVWHAAVLRAYDDRLRLASRCMGIPEYLDQLTGMDLEVERLRVEEELIQAGLHLRLAASPDPTGSPEE